MVLDTPMRAAVELNIPTLPTLGASAADAAIILAGAMPPEGMVVLGLGAAVDKRNDTDTPDGKVGENTDGKVTIKLAPQHGGIEGNPYILVTLAASMAGLFGGEGDMMLSGAIQMMDALPADNKLDVPAFLLPVANATYDHGTRMFAGNEVTGANAYRATLVDGAVTWQVLMPAGNPSFTLPAVPAGMTDLTDPSVTVESWKTKGGLGIDDILEFNGTNLDGVMGLIEGFALVALSGSGGGCDLGIDCSATGGSGLGGAYGWGLIAGLLVVLRRRRTR